MRSCVAIAAVALLLHGGAAEAQQTGPERGVLLSAEAGDIACYLRIRDEKGQSRNWMADFSLCENPERLIGRAVALSWKAGNVQHPSCQGSPECRSTQRVMLITRMQAAPR